MYYKKIPFIQCLVILKSW